MVLVSQGHHLVSQVRDQRLFLPGMRKKSRTERKKRKKGGEGRRT